MFQFPVISERIGKQTRFRILNAICKKLAATLSCPDLEWQRPIILSGLAMTIIAASAACMVGRLRNFARPAV